MFQSIRNYYYFYFQLKPLSFVSVHPVSFSHFATFLDGRVANLPTSGSFFEATI